MKRLAPRFKRLRKIKKFRVAPLQRLQFRAKQAAKKLFRKRLAGKKGENYANLSPADKKKVAELDQGQLYAKELTTEMENLFNSEALMKEFFCWEAATGENKFGKGSQGVANQGK